MNEIVPDEILSVSGRPDAPPAPWCFLIKDKIHVLFVISWVFFLALLSAGMFFFLDGEFFFKPNHFIVPKRSIVAGKPCTRSDYTAY